MRKKIAQFFRQNPAAKYKPREISKHLGIPSHRRHELRQLLKDLDDEGEIMRHRGGRYSLTIDDTTTTGILRVHYDGYGFVIPDEPGISDIFIPRKYMAGALQGDTVAAQVFEDDFDGRLSGRIVKILKRGRKQWVGRMERRGHDFYLVNEEFADPVEIRLEDRTAKINAVGKIIAAEIFEKPSRPGLFGHVTKILGEPHSEKTLIASILSRHEIRQEFPRTAADEAHSMAGGPPPRLLRNRVDLTALPLVTIDGATARDFDDAVCVEKDGHNTILTVAIADVAHYVQPQSALDKEAALRGTSVYLPDFAIHMLPEELAAGLCSLKPDEDRLCLAVRIHFDKGGMMALAEFFTGLMRSKKRCNYEEVQGFFDLGQSEPPFEADVRQCLSLARKLAEQLIHQRKRRGSIDFDLPEAEIIYDGQGHIINITKAKRFFAHQLIEEFMIAANQAVAQVLQANRIPLLYRIHDKPDLTKVKEVLDFAHLVGIPTPPLKTMTDAREVATWLKSFNDHPLEPYIHQLLLRSLKMAVYATGNRGHFGLNLDDYCHFTSPIRRYPDLIVHRQLKEMLHIAGVQKIIHPAKKSLKLPRRKSRLYTAESLMPTGHHASQRERKAMEAERECIQLKRALFMQDHIGDEFAGIIRRLTKFGIFVELAEYFVEGLIHVSDMKGDYYRYDAKRMEMRGRRQRQKPFRPGDHVRVKIKGISLDTREIYLEFARK